MTGEGRQGIPVNGYEGTHTDFAIPNENVVATALHVPVGIGHDLMTACADVIGKYNSARGIETKWSLPSDD